MLAWHWASAGFQRGIKGANICTNSVGCRVGKTTKEKKGDPGASGGRGCQGVSAAGN